MMCIVVTGAQGKDTWDGHRSVEVLGFHRDQQKVNILFLLYLKNKKQDNHLLVLHPGNTGLEVVRFAGALPSHQDEVSSKMGQKNILESVYEDMFKFDYETAKCLQKKGLSPWDSRYGIDDPEEVIIWPAAEHPSDTSVCSGEKVVQDKTQFAPLSTWRIGPFRQVGWVLLAFKMWFCGDTFKKFVEEGMLFTVDGPWRLLSKIKHNFILPFERDTFGDWGKELGRFEDCLGFRQGGHDVIILKPPLADNVVVDMDGSNMITKAPTQPSPSGIADRYITANPGFKLSLSYSDQYVRKESAPGLGSLGDMESIDD